jgi:hypothetical protein
MKKLPKPTDREIVAAFVNTLRSNPLFQETQQVREIILKASDKISERIKWNSLSYYTSADMVTFNHRTDKILLVFHHPTIIRIRSELLLGEYKDRRLIYFENREEIEANKNELTRIIRELVTAIDNH